MRNTTRNRAFNSVSSKVDNSTARSLELTITGLKKGKDVKLNNLVRKFRPRISKGSKVLKIVEKTKYAIDTKGEKQGLRISKLLKVKRPKKRKNVKKTKTKRKKQKQKTTKRKK